MNTPAIIFAKVPMNTATNKIVFGIESNKLPQFHLAKISPDEIAKANEFVRHDKFDWHVNKNRPLCYVFEKFTENENDLPQQLNLVDNCVQVNWLTFPQAAKQILNGTHRNLLQLVVQYISYGLIDESLIAAEYDEEWLKSLKN